VRSFTYDAIGRRLSESTPEAGVVSYYYDSGPDCSGSLTGALIESKDANGNISCNGYDALGRLIAITYSGTDASRTPERHFVYDSATVDGFAMSNGKNHVVEAYTGPVTAKVTDEGFSYNADGFLIATYQMTPHAGGSGPGWYVSTANYFADSHPSSLTTSDATWTFTLDGMGRPYSSTRGSTGVVNSVSYNVLSDVTNTTYSNGDHDDFTYDPVTFDMKTFNASIGATPVSVQGTLTWNSDGTLKTMAIADGFNAANNQSCNYTHDEFVRIASVDCGASIWQQNFTYDRFGNITKTVPPGGTGVFFMPTYATTTNRIAAFSYNANGDLLSDGNYTYTWDATNHPASISNGVNPVYLVRDAFNNVVEQSQSGVYTETQYTPIGRYGLMNGQAYKDISVPMPGGGTEEHLAGASNVVFHHPDMLGSSRISSTSNSRAKYEDTSYAPFGEPYNSTGPNDLFFTGLWQNIVPGLYDTPARQNNPTQGRWSSPDPITGDLLDPQSFNRYTYVRNSPLMLTDPSGLKGECSESSPCKAGEESGHWDGSLQKWVIDGSAHYALLGGDPINHQGTTLYGKIADNLRSMYSKFAQDELRAAHQQALDDVSAEHQRRTETASASCDASGCVVIHGPTVDPWSGMESFVIGMSGGGDMAVVNDAKAWLRTMVESKEYPGNPQTLRQALNNSHFAAELVRLAEKEGPLQSAATKALTRWFKTDIRLAIWEMKGNAGLIDHFNGIGGQYSMNADVADSVAMEGPRTWNQAGKMNKYLQTPTAAGRKPIWMRDDY